MSKETRPISQSDLRSKRDLTRDLLDGRSPSDLSADDISALIETVQLPGISGGQDSSPDAQRYKRVMEELLEAEGIPHYDIPPGIIKHPEAMEAAEKVLGFIPPADDPRWPAVYHYVEIQKRDKGRPPDIQIKTVNEKNAHGAVYLSERESSQTRFRRIQSPTDLLHFVRSLVNLDKHETLKESFEATAQQFDAKLAQGKLPPGFEIKLEKTEKILHDDKTSSRTKPTKVTPCPEALYQIQAHDAQHGYLGRIGFNVHQENGVNVYSVTNVQGADGVESSVYNKIRRENHNKPLFNILLERLEQVAAKTGEPFEIRGLENPNPKGIQDEPDRIEALGKFYNQVFKGSGIKTKQKQWETPEEDETATATKPAQDKPRTVRSNEGNTNKDKKIDSTYITNVQDQFLRERGLDPQFLTPEQKRAALQEANSEVNTYLAKKLVEDGMRAQVEGLVFGKPVVTTPDGKPTDKVNVVVVNKQVLDASASLGLTEIPVKANDKPVDGAKKYAARTYKEKVYSQRDIDQSTQQLQELAHNKALPNTLAKPGNNPEEHYEVLTNPGLGTRMVELGKILAEQGVRISEKDLKAATTSDSYTAQAQAFIEVAQAKLDALNQQGKLNAKEQAALNNNRNVRNGQNVESGTTTEKQPNQVVKPVRGGQDPPRRPPNDKPATEKEPDEEPNSKKESHESKKSLTDLLPVWRREIAQELVDNTGGLGEDEIALILQRQEEEALNALKAKWQAYCKENNIKPEIEDITFIASEPVQVSKPGQDYAGFQEKTVPVVRDVNGRWVAVNLASPNPNEQALTSSDDKEKAKASSKEALQSTYQRSMYDAEQVHNTAEKIAELVDDGALPDTFRRVVAEERAYTKDELDFLTSGKAQQVIRQVEQIEGSEVRITDGEFKKAARKANARTAEQLAEVYVQEVRRVSEALDQIQDGQTQTTSTEQSDKKGSANVEILNNTLEALGVTQDEFFAGYDGKEVLDFLDDPAAVDRAIKLGSQLLHTGTPQQRDNYIRTHGNSVDNRDAVPKPHRDRWSNIEVNSEAALKQKRDIQETKRRLAESNRNKDIEEYYGSDEKKGTRIQGNGENNAIYRIEGSSETNVHVVSREAIPFDNLTPSEKLQHEKRNVEAHMRTLAALKEKGFDVAEAVPVRITDGQGRTIGWKLLVEDLTQGGKYTVQETHDQWARVYDENGNLIRTVLTDLDEVVPTFNDFMFANEQDAITVQTGNQQQNRNQQREQGNQNQDAAQNTTKGNEGNGQTNKTQGGGKEPPNKPPSDTPAAAEEPEDDKKSQQELLKSIDKYRLNENSSFYFITDPEVAKQVAERLKQGDMPYGIEFGPGYVSSQLETVDPSISTWIAYEPDLDVYQRASSIVESLEPHMGMSGTSAVIYVPLAMTDKDINPDIDSLQTVVYRNPDYRDPVPFPNKEFMERGKRVVLINNHQHIDEKRFYERFLKEQGIDSQKLVHSQQPMIVSVVEKEQDSYIYDSAGTLTNAAPDSAPPQDHKPSSGSGGKPPDKPPSKSEPDHEEEPNKESPEERAKREALHEKLAPYRVPGTNTFLIPANKKAEVMDAIRNSDVPMMAELGPAEAPMDPNKVDPTLHASVAFEIDSALFADSLEFMPEDMRRNPTDSTLIYVEGRFDREEIDTLTNVTTLAARNPRPGTFEELNDPNRAVVIAVDDLYGTDLQPYQDWVRKHQLGGGFQETAQSTSAIPKPDYAQKPKYVYRSGRSQTTGDTTVTNTNVTANTPDAERQNEINARYPLYAKVMQGIASLEFLQRNKQEYTERDQAFIAQLNKDIEELGGIQAIEEEIAKNYVDTARPSSHINLNWQDLGQNGYPFMNASSLNNTVSEAVTQYQQLTQEIDKGTVRATEMLKQNIQTLKNLVTNSDIDEAEKIKLLSQIDNALQGGQATNINEVLQQDESIQKTEKMLQFINDLQQEIARDLTNRDDDKPLTDQELTQAFFGETRQAVDAFEKELTRYFKSQGLTMQQIKELNIHQVEMILQDEIEVEQPGTDQKDKIQKHLVVRFKNPYTGQIEDIDISAPQFGFSEGQRVQRFQAPDEATADRNTRAYYAEQFHTETYDLRKYRQNRWEFMKLQDSGVIPQEVDRSSSSRFGKPDDFEFFGNPENWERFMARVEQIRAAGKELTPEEWNEVIAEVLAGGDNTQQNIRTQTETIQQNTTDQPKTQSSGGGGKPPEDPPVNEGPADDETGKPKPALPPEVQAALEQYRKGENLYFIPKDKAEEILKLLADSETPMMAEFGPAGRPVDPRAFGENVSVAFEPDNYFFNAAQGLLRINLRKNPNDSTIIYVEAPLTEQVLEDMPNITSITARNPQYNSFRLFGSNPAVGDRPVNIIIDSFHLMEIPYYQSWLRENGIEGDFTEEAVNPYNFVPDLGQETTEAYVYRSRPNTPPSDEKPPTPPTPPPSGGPTPPRPPKPPGGDAPAGGDAPGGGRQPENQPTQPANLTEEQIRQMVEENPDNFVFHGTSQQAMQYAQEHGGFAGATGNVQENDPGLPQPGNFYVTSPADLGPEEAYKQAKGHANAVAQQHEFLEQLGIPLDNVQGVLAANYLLGELGRETDPARIRERLDEVMQRFPEIREVVEAFMDEHGFDLDTIASALHGAAGAEGVVVVLDRNKMPGEPEMTKEDDLRYQTAPNMEAVVGTETSTERVRLDANTSPAEENEEETNTEEPEDITDAIAALAGELAGNNLEVHRYLTMQMLMAIANGGDPEEVINSFREAQGDETPHPFDITADAVRAALPELERIQQNFKEDTDAEREPVKDFDDEGRRRKFDSYKKLQEELGPEEDPAKIKEWLRDQEAQKNAAEAIPPISETDADKVRAAVDQSTSNKRFAQEIINVLQEAATQFKERGLHDAAAEYTKKMQDIQAALKVGDEELLRALLRENDTCMPQTEWIQNDIEIMMMREGIDSMQILTALGLTATSDIHQILLAVPNSAETKEIIRQLMQLEKQGNINAVFSLDSMLHDQAANIGDVTVIDPTLAQMFSANPKLRGLNPQEKLNYLRQIAPNNVTENGVYIGSFADYVALVTTIDPRHRGEVEFMLRYPKQVIPDSSESTETKLDDDTTNRDTQPLGNKTNDDDPKPVAKPEPDPEATLEPDAIDDNGNTFEDTSSTKPKTVLVEGQDPNNTEMNRKAYEDPAFNRVMQGLIGTEALAALSKEEYERLYEMYSAFHEHHIEEPLHNRLNEIYDKSASERAAARFIRDEWQKGLQGLQECMAQALGIDPEQLSETLLNIAHGAEYTFTAPPAKPDDTEDKKDGNDDDPKPPPNDPGDDNGGKPKGPPPPPAAPGNARTEEENQTETVEAKDKFDEMMEQALGTDAWNKLNNSLWPEARTQLRNHLLQGLFPQAEPANGQTQNINTVPAGAALSMRNLARFLGCEPQEVADRLRDIANGVETFEPRPRNTDNAYPGNTYTNGTAPAHANNGYNGSEDLGTTTITDEVLDAYNRAVQTAQQEMANPQTPADSSATVNDNGSEPKDATVVDNAYKAAIRWYKQLIGAEQENNNPKPTNHDSIEVNPMQNGQLYSGEALEFTTPTTGTSKVETPENRPRRDIAAEQTAQAVAQQVKQQFIDIHGSVINKAMVMIGEKLPVGPNTQEAVNMEFAAMTETEIKEIEQKITMLNELEQVYADRIEAMKKKIEEMRHKQMAKLNTEELIAERKAKEAQFNRKDAELEKLKKIRDQQAALNEKIKEKEDIVDAATQERQNVIEAAEILEMLEEYIQELQGLEENETFQDEVQNMIAGNSAATELQQQFIRGDISANEFFDQLQMLAPTMVKHYQDQQNQAGNGNQSRRPTYANMLMNAARGGQDVQTMKERADEFNRRWRMFGPRLYPAVGTIISTSEMVGSVAGTLSLAGAKLPFQVVALGAKAGKALVEELVAETKDIIENDLPDADAAKKAAGKAAKVAGKVALGTAAVATAPLWLPFAVGAAAKGAKQGKQAMDQQRHAWKHGYAASGTDNTSTQKSSGGKSKKEKKPGFMKKMMKELFSTEGMGGGWTDGTLPDTSYEGMLQRTRNYAANGGKTEQQIKDEIRRKKEQDARDLDRHLAHNAIDAAQRSGALYQDQAEKLRSMLANGDNPEDMQGYINGYRRSNEDASNRAYANDLIDDAERRGHIDIDQARRLRGEVTTDFTDTRNAIDGYRKSNDERRLEQWYEEQDAIKRAKQRQSQEEYAQDGNQALPEQDYRPAYDGESDGGHGTGSGKKNNKRRGYEVPWDDNNAQYEEPADQGDHRDGPGDHPSDNGKRKGKNVEPDYQVRYDDNDDYDYGYNDAQFIPSPNNAPRDAEEVAYVENPQTEQEGHLPDLKQVGNQPDPEPIEKGSPDELDEAAQKLHDAIQEAESAKDERVQEAKEKFDEAYNKPNPDADDDTLEKAERAAKEYQWVKENAD